MCDPNGQPAAWDSARGSCRLPGDYFDSSADRGTRSGCAAGGCGGKCRHGASDACDRMLVALREGKDDGVIDTGRAELQHALNAFGVGAKDHMGVDKSI